MRLPGEGRAEKLLPCLNMTPLLAFYALIPTARVRGRSFRGEVKRAWIPGTSWSESGENR